MRLAPAQLGSSTPLLPASRNRGPASAHPGADRGRRQARRSGRHRSLVRPRGERTTRRRCRALPQDERHARRLVRLGRHTRKRPARLAPRRTGVSGRSLSRRFGPASRLVPELPADRLRDGRPCPVQGTADARLRGRRQGPEDVEVQGQRDCPAEDCRHPRRRYSPSVGGGYRLLGRVVDLRRDSQARRRSLPPDPQYAALPACQHGRLRRDARHARSRALAGNRPLCTGHDTATAGAMRSRLRQVRVPPRRPVAADLLFRGSRRLLPRHPQGPVVHHSGRFHRTPLGAERALAHPAMLHQVDGADSLLHRRGDLATAE